MADDMNADLINATDQVADDPGKPMIITDGDTAASDSAKYEPGLVEVQLNDDVIPTISGVTLDSSTADMGAFNKALGDLQAQEVIYTFRGLQTGAGGDSSSNGAPSTDLADLPDLRNFLTLRFAEDADVQAAATRLRQVAEVKAALPVPIIAPPAVVPQPMVGDPLTGVSDQLVTDPKTGLQNQWYIFRCRLDQAWLKHDGNGVIIADIDFGFRTTHQDLRQNIDNAHTYNAFDGSSNVSQGNQTFHGTGVLGLAAATMNNVGMCGAAVNATTWPIQANTGGTALAGFSWANAMWEFENPSDASLVSTVFRRTPL